MAIEIEWQDENQQLLAAYAGPDLTADILAIAEDSTACIRFIDPYGDTVFNQLQLPVLMAELETTALEAQDPAKLAVIRAVLDFLEQARDQAHTYIWFIGD